jgi:hypothetical protein
MNTQPDFEDFLRLLEVHCVDYMIVGGYAVAYHGFPRFTKDIDVFFSDSPENLQRLQAALVTSGFGPDTVPIDTTQRHHFRPPRAAVFNRRQQPAYSVLSLGGTPRST